MTTSSKAMTTANDQYAPMSTGPTTAMPGAIEMEAVLPELSSPQERYDNGFKRGYLAGYAEGARQAQAERAGDLAAQKANWAGILARAGALVSQLASATDEYVARFGPRDGALTEQLISAAFELAEAVIGCEVRTRPELAIEKARAILATMPAGPPVVRVNPGDEALMLDAAAALGNSRYGVSVLVDPSVGPGGCVVTSQAKTVDARIEEALAHAREAFCTPVADGQLEDSSYTHAGGYGDTVL
jgi:flagellar assembly protein FliH